MWYPLFLITSRGLIFRKAERYLIVLFLHVGTVLVLLTAAQKIKHQSHGRSTSGEGRLLQRSCIHLKGHNTSVKAKIHDTERGSKFYSARQPLHCPLRSQGERGKQGCQPRSKHRVDLLGMPSPSGQQHQGCFSLASPGDERPSLWALAAAALRGRGLWAPCLAAPRQPAWGNSGHGIWAAQAARKACAVSREADVISSPPAEGTAAIRERGWERRRARGEAPAVPSPAVGPAEGSGPGQGQRPREEGALRAERQQGCTRRKSREFRASCRTPPRVWGQWWHAGQRRGQEHGTGGSVVTSPGNALNRVTAGTAAGQTPPCRNTDISQAASNRKSCMNNVKKLKSSS